MVLLGLLEVCEHYYTIYSTRRAALSWNQTCRTTASGSSNDNFASQTITHRESGLLSAGVALTWDRSSEPPPRVLPAGLSLDAPLSSSGSSRVEFPAFNGTIRALRLPAAPPAALRFLRLAVPREHSRFRSRGRRVSRRRAWGWSPGIPVRDFFHGDDRISHVPGEPVVPMPCSSTPAGSACQATCDTPTRPPL